MGEDSARYVKVVNDIYEVYLKYVAKPLPSYTSLCRTKGAEAVEWQWQQPILNHISHRQWASCLQYLSLQDKIDESANRVWVSCPVNPRVWSKPVEAQQPLSILLYPRWLDFLAQGLEAESLMSINPDRVVALFLCKRLAPVFIHHGRATLNCNSESAILACPKLCVIAALQTANMIRRGLLRMVSCFISRTQFSVPAFSPGHEPICSLHLSY